MIGRLILAVAASALVPNPSLAQGVGRFPADRQLTTRYDATTVEAACVLRKNHDQSVALVMIDEDRPVVRKLDAALTNCVKSYSLTMNVQELKVIMADLLLHENGNAMLSRAAKMSAATPVRVTTAGKRPAEQVFGCVAKAQPAAAAAMLSEARATPAEGAAFRALAPTLQSCVPTGVALSVKPGEIRGLMAVALVRRLNDVPADGIGARGGRER